jgi:hypothetical protein
MPTITTSDGTEILFRGRGMRPIEARVALARCACRLTHRLPLSQQPYDEQRYSRSRCRGR